MRIKELKIQARERFALNIPAMLVYGVAYTIALNIAILTTALCLLSGYAVWYGVILALVFLLALCLLGYGMAGFYLRLYRFDKCDGSSIFDGFKKRRNFERILVMRLIQFGLWLALTILLIVPGILFLLRTCMATYILRTEPTKKPTEALRESNMLMKTHTRKFFLLVLSFAGWFFVGLITCGLGFIWVTPYFNATKVVFYGREVLGDTTEYRKPANLNSVPAAAQKEPQPLRDIPIGTGQPNRPIAPDAPSKKEPSAPPNDITQEFTPDEIPIIDFPVRDYEEESYDEPRETVVTKNESVQDVFAEEHWKIPYTPAEDDEAEPPQTEAEAPKEIFEETPAPVRMPTEHAARSTRIVDDRAASDRATAERRTDRAAGERRGAERSVRTETDGVRRHESRPLPGGRVVMGAEGRPVMERRTADNNRAETRQETRRPATENREEPPLSAGERLERLRAERMAERAARESKQDNTDR